MVEYFNGKEDDALDIISYLTDLIFKYNESAIIARYDKEAPNLYSIISRPIKDDFNSRNHSMFDVQGLLEEDILDMLYSRDTKDNIRIKRVKTENMDLILFSLMLYLETLKDGYIIHTLSTRMTVQTPDEVFLAKLRYSSSFLRLPEGYEFEFTDELKSEYKKYIEELRAPLSINDTYQLLKDKGKRLGMKITYE